MTPTRHVPPSPAKPRAGHCAGPLALAGAVLLLAGCKVGPNYAPPSMSMPPAYGEPAGAAAATDSAGGEIAWWHHFNDEELSSLVERAVAANNNVKVAEA